MSSSNPPMQDDCRENEHCPKPRAPDGVLVKQVGSNDTVNLTVNVQRTESGGGVPSFQRAHKWSNANKNAVTQPSNCIVMKNLDYSMTQKDITSVLDKVMSKPRQVVNMTLVDDKVTGTFRGMAFVTFASVDDATATLTDLSNVVINERRVIVQYRRTTRPADRKDGSQHDKRTKKSTESYFSKNQNTNSSSFDKTVDKRALFFANRGTERRTIDRDHKRHDEDVTQTERERAREAEFRKLLSDYAAGSFQEGDEQHANVHVDKDMRFDSSLSSYERRVVHCICEELQLGHVSRFDESGQRVLHVTRDPVKTAEWAKEAPSPKEGRKGGAAETRRRAAAKTASEEGRSNKFVARGSKGEDGNAGALRPPSYKVYTPERQPTGPDASSGFLVRRRHHGLEEPADLPGASGNQNGGSQESAEGTGEKKKILNGRKGKSGKGRKVPQSVLNPSVPAFSPMNGVCME